MDGTIVAPIFEINGRFKTSLDEDEWQAFFREHGDKGYENCVPVQPVINFAQKLRNAGWNVKILTIANTDPERSAKWACFRNMKLGQIFSDMYFVSSTRNKTLFIHDYMQVHHLKPEACMYIDDNIQTLTNIQALGCRTIHVSHITAGLCGDEIIPRFKPLFDV